MLLLPEPLLCPDAVEEERDPEFELKPDPGTDSGGGSETSGSTVLSLKLLSGGSLSGIPEVWALSGGCELPVPVLTEAVPDEPSAVLCG